MTLSSSSLRVHGLYLMVSVALFCCLLQIPVLLLNNVIKGNPWTKVDVNIGKIAELYGD